MGLVVKTSGDFDFDCGRLIVVSDRTVGLEGRNSEVPD